MEKLWKKLVAPIAKTYAYLIEDNSEHQKSKRNKEVSIKRELMFENKYLANWNKYLAKPKLLPPNPNLNHLIESSFQGVNRILVLAFENEDQRTSNKGYYLPNVEIKDYFVMIDGKNFFDQPVKNNKVTYESIRQIATGQGDDYTSGCLLDYIYFKNYYKMIAIDLSKQRQFKGNSTN